MTPRRRHSFSTSHRRRLGVLLQAFGGGCACTRTVYSARSSSPVSRPRHVMFLRSTRAPAYAACSAHECSAGPSRYWRAARRRARSQRSTLGVRPLDSLTCISLYVLVPSSLLRPRVVRPPFLSTTFFCYSLTRFVLLSCYSPASPCLSLHMHWTPELLLALSYTAWLLKT